MNADASTVAARWKHALDRLALLLADVEVVLDDCGTYDGLGSGDQATRSPLTCEAPGPGVCAACYRPRPTESPSAIGTPIGQHAWRAFAEPRLGPKVRPPGFSIGAAWEAPVVASGIGVVRYGDLPSTLRLEPALDYYASDPQPCFEVIDDRDGSDALDLWVDGVGDHHRATDADLVLVPDGEAVQLGRPLIRRRLSASLIRHRAQHTDWLRRLLELAPPDQPERIAHVYGSVSVRRGLGRLVVDVVTDDGDVIEHALPPKRIGDLRVKDGDYVRPGDRLLWGPHPDFREQLDVMGVKAAALAWLREVAADLSYRRVAVDGRDLELVARQLVRWSRREDGTPAPREQLEDEVDAAVNSGTEPPRIRPVFLGLSEAVQAALLLSPAASLLVD